MELQQGVLVAHVARVSKVTNELHVGPSRELIAVQCNAF